MITFRTRLPDREIITIDLTRTRSHSDTLRSLFSERKAHHTRGMSISDLMTIPNFTPCEKPV